VFRSLLLILFAAACSSYPVKKELLYKGEPLSQIVPYGVLVGHAMVPNGVFPFDRRSAVIYIENLKTKEEIHYGETLGPFYLKLPPGDYAIKNLWSGGMCNSSPEIMISSIFSELPDSMSYLKTHLQDEPGSPLSFRIAAGKMTDIGNLLMTCFEWSGHPKFKKEFITFVQDGKFQLFRLLSSESQDCGCKIVRKKDGVSIREMNKSLKSH
jgi:hypothetical protein